MSNILLPLLDRRWSAIAIGASTGGPRILTEIMGSLSDNKQAPPIFIVQHMPRGFTAAFAQRLDSLCSLKVVEAKNGEKIQKGYVYIAPGDFHMTIQRQQIALNQGERHLGVRPSVDYLFSSAAKVYKNELLSIILTGMGRDGTEGMKDTKKYGGVNLAQDKESSVIFGMPGSAIDGGVIDQVLSLREIIYQLNELLKR